MKYVYALLDADGAWRYIGASSDPKRRISQYRDHASGRAELNHWLASLTKAPRQIILESVPADGDWREAECAWIGRALALGHPLVNCQHNPNGRIDRRAPRAALPTWLASRARRPSTHETASLRRAHADCERAIAEREESRSIRDDAIRAAIRAGLTHADVFRELGETITRTRIGQIALEGKDKEDGS